MARRSYTTRRRIDDDPALPREEIVEEHVVDEPMLESERGTEVQETGYPHWSPAQPVTFVLGVGFLVLGAVALARAGLGGLFDHVTVANLEHTQLLAIIHLAAGVLFLAGTASPDGSRGVLAFLGALSLAFGIIVYIEPTLLNPWLGVSQEHGVVYMVVGAIALVVGVASPVFGGRRRYYRRWWR